MGLPIIHVVSDATLRQIKGEHNTYAKNIGNFCTLTKEKKPANLAFIIARDNAAKREATNSHRDINNKTKCENTTRYSKKIIFKKKTVRHFGFASCPQPYY